MSDELPPTPGATVVPLRDGPDGLEVLMIERAAALAYGGMWAFPGGRVDPGDADPADPADEVARARRAAVREADEEVGLRFRARLARDLQPLDRRRQQRAAVRGLVLPRPRRPTAR